MRIVYKPLKQQFYDTITGQKKPESIVHYLEDGEGNHLGVISAHYPDVENFCKDLCEIWNENEARWEAEKQKVKAKDCQE